jgi:hypothetical protein
VNDPLEVADTILVKSAVSVETPGGIPLRRDPFRGKSALLVVRGMGILAHVFACHGLPARVHGQGCPCHGC